MVQFEPTVFPRYRPTSVTFCFVLCLFRAPATLFLGKESQLPIGNPFWAPWTKVKCLVLPATKPRLFDRPSRSLVTIRTELFRPLKVPISITYGSQMYGIILFRKDIFLRHVLKKCRSFIPFLITVRFRQYVYPTYCYVFQTARMHVKLWQKMTPLQPQTTWKTRHYDTKPKQSLQSAVQCRAQHLRGTCNYAASV
jgi:hypothetical protein